VVDRATEDKIARNEGKLATATGKYFAQRNAGVGRLLYAEAAQDAAAAHDAVWVDFHTEHYTATARFPGVTPGLLAHMKDRAFAAQGRWSRVRAGGA
jgi:hypothetical protein